MLDRQNNPTWEIKEAPKQITKECEKSAAPDVRFRQPGDQRRVLNGV